jgi:phospholipid/cholesterol/gamma-HCH transport system substrate-binding protein
MEAEARYTFVGAALIVLVAGLVTAVLWLKNVGSRLDYNYYAIYFEQQALDGLQIGADVNLRGIKIGRVEDYALSRESINRVRVVVRIDRRVPVLTNTFAVVTRNFVTGIAQILLVNPLPPGEPLTEVPPNGVYPVIAEGRSDIDEIAGRVTELGNLAGEALTNVNRVLTPENRAAITRTLRNLRDASDRLNQRLATLDSTLVEVGDAATQVRSAAGGLERAGDRIATVAERSGAGLDKTLAEAQQTLAAARGAIDRVAGAVDVLERQATHTARRLEATAGGVDDQLAAAVADLRLSVDAATRSLDRLRDPRAALLGPAKAQLGPGEQLP